MITILSLPVAFFLAGNSYMNPWSAQCVQNTLELLKGYGHGLREFHQGKTKDTHTCTLVDKSGQAQNVVDTSLCPLPSTLLLPLPLHSSSFLLSLLLSSSSLLLSLPSLLLSTSLLSYSLPSHSKTM